MTFLLKNAASASGKRLEDWCDRSDRSANRRLPASRSSLFLATCLRLLLLRPCCSRFPAMIPRSSSFLSSAQFVLRRSLETAPQDKD